MIITERSDIQYVRKGYRSCQHFDWRKCRCRYLLRCLHPLMSELPILVINKSRRMTFIDFISAVGGLLGGFMGFSFVSGIEILYWMLVLIFKNKRQE